MEPRQLRDHADWSGNSNQPPLAGWWRHQRLHSAHDRNRFLRRWHEARGNLSFVLVPWERRLPPASFIRRLCRTGGESQRFSDEDCDKVSDKVGSEPTCATAKG